MQIILTLEKFREYVSVLSFSWQLRDAINSREQVLLDKLVSLHQSKESILTGQLERLQLNKACLESAIEQAKSSIQSPGDVNFLLSRLTDYSVHFRDKSWKLLFSAWTGRPVFTGVYKGRKGEISIIV